MISKRGRVDVVNGAYASFVWGIPAETDPLYPSFGLATRVSEADGLLSVPDAEKGSPAARAGQDVALTVLFRRELRAPATPAPYASRGTP